MSTCLLLRTHAVDLPRRKEKKVQKKNFIIHFAAEWNELNDKINAHEKKIHFFYMQKLNLGEIYLVNDAKVKLKYLWIFFVSLDVSLSVYLSFTPSNNENKKKIKKKSARMFLAINFLTAIACKQNKTQKKNKNIVALISKAWIAKKKERNAKKKVKYFFILHFNSHFYFTSVVKQ